MSALTKVATLLVGLVCAGSALAQKLVAPPPGTVYHGAYPDFGPTASKVTAQAIQQFQDLANKRVAWAYFSNDWLDGNITFPTASVNACKDAGTTPYIRMMPWSRMEGGSVPDPVFTHSRFLRGDFDGPLRQWMRQARSFASPILVEFGPEVNGDWFPWNGRWNGGSTTKAYGDPSWPDGPERFRDVFRRIVSLSREEGADNITWILHVDVQAQPEAAWNALRYYDPGEEYVDWIGLSVFGAQLPNHDWEGFVPRLQRVWPEVKELAGGRPILIAETAVIERRPGQKARWITQAYQAISSGAFPAIVGVSWWHSPGWLQNGTASFRIDSSADALESYKKAVASPEWKTEGIFE
jgi:hypothetical protein